MCGVLYTRCRGFGCNSSWEMQPILSIAESVVLSTLVVGEVVGCECRAFGNKVFC